ncbi:MbtH family protein [Phenylobacterium sp.]|jgi:MbtH protein|uniref:MbtH family protein n=1 Tax=Phenylobacterium sp. TaxID=1871053 RepID=UPI0037CA79CB
MAFEEDDIQTYFVLVNDEEQMSLWPQATPVPSGWRLTGQEGPKDACLQYVNEMWTDLRPRSLRLGAESTDPVSGPAS